MIGNFRGAYGSHVFMKIFIGPLFFANWHIILCGQSVLDYFGRQGLLTHRAYTSRDVLLFVLSVGMLLIIQVNPLTVHANLRVPSENHCDKRIPGQTNLYRKQTSAICMEGGEVAISLQRYHRAAADQVLLTHIRIFIDFLDGTRAKKSHVGTAR